MNLTKQNIIKQTVNVRKLFIVNKGRIGYAETKGY